MRILVFSDSCQQIDLLKSILFCFEVHTQSVSEIPKVINLLKKPINEYTAIILVLQNSTEKKLLSLPCLINMTIPVIIINSDHGYLNQFALHQKLLFRIIKPISDLYNTIMNMHPEHNIRLGKYIILSKDVLLDIAGHCIRKNNHSIHLSSIEFKLLLFLIQNKETTLSPQHLIDEIGLSGLSTLYVHIQNVRKKIEKDPKQPTILINIKGQGYKINTESSIEPSNTYLLR
ncbi:winged helix-turn-helix domain-containing protein [Paenibacillus elgii]|uniref:winged helix-turn-helix domain-containing protein n=1 Tax=Paenibacillus elgii TaxID=189691 RepID=UPI000248C798|nr:winged helix-turn-helix domain-containing protein [Paenibacillus elgii]